MKTLIKKYNIGGIKKISVKDIQESFFNENLEDERKVNFNLNKKTNSRERLAKFLLKESESPNFEKLYNFFKRMTEEEFAMFESIIREKMQIFNENSDNITKIASRIFKENFENKNYSKERFFEEGFKIGFNYSKKKINKEI